MSLLSAKTDSVNTFWLRLLPYLFTFLLIASFSLWAEDYPPRPAGAVADFAKIVDDPTKQKITDLAQALWEQAGFGLVVATFPALGSYSIDEYAPELYKRWGIGKKETDEGVLILLSLDPRGVRIEVGYGAEGYITDAKAGRILDEYGMPSFRNNDFSTGLLNVSAALAQVVAQEKGINLTMPSGYRGPAQPQAPPRLSGFQLLVLLIVLALMLGTRTGRTILWALILSSLMGGGRGGRSGGFGGGFGGGGFGGGFGGGMSGGGGASRRF